MNFDRLLVFGRLVDGTPGPNGSITSLQPQGNAIRRRLLKDIQFLHFQGIGVWLTYVKMACKGTAGAFTADDVAAPAERQCVSLAGHDRERIAGGDRSDAVHGR